uniref:C2H2-type domain-containing protein n=1 Tax=Chlamydomonas leiostraca TaxID=1034604 RepID=A0A7S0RM70_9CHLO|mmetsp:Transcript_2661/g.6758  ORF Transcript_2661/g.6758 Transcript_2661/m.6758 type:complete len:300 (+) Transcript_2661:2-901(+)
MVWFVCDGCGDTFKKPKLQSHFGCGPSFTCVDCCVTFDRNGAKGHSQCVTEHEKYALGATKPGGFAANGLPGNREQAQPKSQDNEPSGLEFLSTRPPWRCSVCNVNCTSKDTLMSHASGVKHKRRARAATAAANGGANGAAEGQQGASTDANQTAQEPPTPQQQGEVKSPEASQPATTKAASNDKKRPAQDSDSDSSSSSSSDSDSDSEAAAKKKQKKQPGSAAAHPALADASALAAFIKASKKKIEKKGKLGGKLLQKLAAKKLGHKQADDTLLQAIKNKLVESGVGKIKGKFLVASA